MLNRNNLNYIYECIDGLASFNFYRNIVLKRKVFIIEPFHTYHHRKNIRFFPTPLPSRAEELISIGKAKLISAEDLKSRDIYLLSAEKAVDAVEDVYPAYRKRNEKLFSLVSSCLGVPEAENAFKITLCNNLAEFYSTNILLHRIEALFKDEPICFSPVINVNSYSFMRRLLCESGKDFYPHEAVSFSKTSHLSARANHLKANLFLSLKLCAQVLASGIVGMIQDKSNSEKKLFPFGISVVGPRQLRDTQRSPDFMLGSIRDSKVVFFPLLPLAKNQEEKLREYAGEVCPVPRPGKVFSNCEEWFKLLFLGIRDHLMKTPDELYTAALVLYNYYAWKYVLKRYSVNHFISHADFGVPQVGRNIALNQAGSQTWYFTDSMNHVCYFQNPGKTKGRHPFWTYLNYDHFVTWTPALANYYKSHPGTFRQPHVVGCLWSEHLRDKNEARKNSTFSGFFKSEDPFVITCFDSTYTRNGFTNYSEGLEFAEHLLRLVEDNPKIFLIIKEKKDRGIHFTLDPVAGPKLMELYDRMNTHPGIHFCSNQVDASEIISISDLVISFPFTSTTFEALCNNRPSIWHDAAGYYKESIFGHIPGLVTYGYEGLKTRVLEEISAAKRGKNGNCIDINSPLLDPYRDGRAIERFHNLLTQSTRKDEICKS